MKIFATSLSSETMLWFSTRSYVFKVLSHDFSENFYSFPQFFVVYNAFDIQIWKVTSFFFLRSLTHLILFLLYTFRSSSDLLFRNLFLNFDLTMIAFLSSLFINDACLAPTYFFWGVQNFLKMLNKHFENPLNRNSKLSLRYSLNDFWSKFL